MWKPEKELGKEDRNSLDKCIELYPELKGNYNTIQICRKSNEGCSNLFTMD